MQQTQQSRTAYKLWISNLLSANPVFDGDRFSHLELNGKEILRTNIIANVIDKYVSENPDKPFAALTLDDGSGQIRVKAFRDIMPLVLGQNIGETVCVIGSLHFFNDEIYILPEIVRKLEPEWALLRKLELKKLYPIEKKSTEKSNVKESLLAQIKESDEGIDIDKLIMNNSFSVDEINSVVAKLIEDGEIYEPRPGRLRSVN